MLWNRLTPDADMVTGWKIARSDPWHRIVIGKLYHHTVRLLFRLRVRDEAFAARERGGTAERAGQDRQRLGREEAEDVGVGPENG